MREAIALGEAVSDLRTVVGRVATAIAVSTSDTSSGACTIDGTGHVICIGDLGIGFDTRGVLRLRRPVSSPASAAPSPSRCWTDARARSAGMATSAASAARAPEAMRSLGTQVPDGSGA